MLYTNFKGALTFILISVCGFPCCLYAANLTDLINSVSTWNWMDYTKKHLAVWEYLLHLENKISYSIESDDGINSVEEHDISVPINSHTYFQLMKTIVFNKIKHFIVKKLNSLKSMLERRGN